MTDRINIIGHVIGFKGLSQLGLLKWAVNQTLTQKSDFRHHILKILKIHKITQPTLQLNKYESCLTQNNNSVMLTVVEVLGVNRMLPNHRDQQHETDCRSPVSVHAEYKGTLCLSP